MRGLSKDIGLVGRAQGAMIVSLLAFPGPHFPQKKW